MLAKASRLRELSKRVASNFVHLSKKGQWITALGVAFGLSPFGATSSLPREILPDQVGLYPETEKLEPLRQIITAKNRLWFDYWRVQNWAFLAGDRTEQPSSRDHLDRTKRWFPAERERFLPLIEKKEQEIWALAAKLAQP